MIIRQNIWNETHLTRMTRVPLEAGSQGYWIANPTTTSTSEPISSNSFQNIPITVR